MQSLCRPPVAMRFVTAKKPSVAACTMTMRITTQQRTFSSAEKFQPKAPESLTTEMAEGIVEATKFYSLHGISNQRFRALAKENFPVHEKWQKMMEIYLQTQAHVIAGLGYQADEQGLTLYAQHLQKCIQSTDQTMRELFMDVRRETWRAIVATTFQVPKEEIPVLSIVDARNLMHKISSKMIEPDTLLVIQHKTAKIQHEDRNMEIAMKHAVLQEILVQLVYVGGEPSLVEQEGFGSGAKGYAKLQCAMTDHEGDPLLSEYSASAMVKILEAAGIDFNDLTGPGEESQERPNAMPIPGTGKIS